MVASRLERGSWADTADELASAFDEIGRRWEAGACRIFEEHAATEAVRRAAAACVAEMRYRDDAPATALFTVEGERHTLGLALAELVVAEAGSRPIWVGEGPPAEELGALVARFKPQTLLVAASPATPPKAVAAYEKALRDVARTTGVDLILAGAGHWRDDSNVRRIWAFGELREALS